MDKKRIVIIGMGALMEKLLPCYEKFLGNDMPTHLIATTADDSDIERKRRIMPFEILLGDNKAALEEMQPDIIVFAVPPQLAAETAERDLLPYYETCRREGTAIPALYVFPPRPAAEFYLDLLGADLKVCHILPNVIMSIAGEKLENEGLNFITLSEKSKWIEEDRNQLQDFLSATGACIYLKPSEVMIIMTSGVSVINYAFVLKTMAEALAGEGNNLSINTIAQGCRYALEEYTGFKPANNAAVKPDLSPRILGAISCYTIKYYDGLMKYCTQHGLSEATAKSFLDGYFDFYLHYYMSESEDKITELVASQTTKGGVAEKGEQIYRETMEHRLREVFACFGTEEPDSDFYKYVEEYVYDCSVKVLEHGANMGRRK